VVRRVVIFNRVVPDYRVSFYRTLSARLDEAGCELTVAGGAPWPHEALDDAVDRTPGGHRLHHRRLLWKAYWSPGALTLARDASLVVTEQANAALVNYPLLLRRALGRRRPRLAFFGHGAHLNAVRREPLRDASKAALARRVDWWFAYTERSAAIVRSLGFPDERITVVNNAVDTHALRRARADLDRAELEALAAKLFAGAGAAAPGPTGVFCGRLVPLKWIPFLLESLDRVRALVPGFRAVLVGDGPERGRVRAFCASRPWCAWVGARRGAERVPYLALGDLWLNPGVLGLAVVDALALSLPVATTDNGIHSPEIVYLEPGRNGLSTPPDVASYAGGVAAVLRDPARLAELSAGAGADAERYSTDEMAQRFAAGIEACLAEATGR
jgi:glycosyltransferase involved in cell wall biosynthesis